MTRDERELKWQRFQQHEFPMPSPNLAPYVARYWIVTWEYTQPYRQLIVPYPNVHLSFGGGVAEVRGVSSGHVFRELDGSGWVFGVAFQPGCFRPFLGGPVQSITDRSIPAAEVFRDLPDGADEADEAYASRAVEPTPSTLSPQPPVTWSGPQGSPASVRLRSFTAIRSIPRRSSTRHSPAWSTEMPSCCRSLPATVVQLDGRETK